MRRNLKHGSGSSVDDLSSNTHAWEVIRTLVNGGTDPSRLLELYYWTREPGIIELIRAYLSLPEAAQRRLGDFLLNSRPRSIDAALDAEGRLVLSRSVASMQTRPEGLRRTSGR
jgi:hypothetical protein